MKSSVTYPIGFYAAASACGLKKDGKLDLCIITSESDASCAGVFTKNVVKGHSLEVSREHVAGGTARAIYVNAGNANACVGPEGMQDARDICAKIAEHIGCAPEQVLPNSTGVIGVRLPMDKISAGVDEALAALSEDGGESASLAIMTTDTHPKAAQAEATIDGRKVRIGAIAKGSGMIHPNMATMISLITTDADIAPALLQDILKKCADRTYNRVSVDGDTSVCDTVLMLANGMSGVEVDSTDGAFFDALLEVCTTLAKMLAADGEGATKLMSINVTSAPDGDAAKLIANAIAKSPLCKTAAFGEDANWGRILTAAGYSGADFDPAKCRLYIGGLLVYDRGLGIVFDEDEAAKILAKDEVEYVFQMNQGEGSYNVWSCDFSYDYVKINGSYRT
jgi:glutamate N-acetyltransferase/amino-acid N-acetyltransferase